MMNKTLRILPISAALMACAATWSSGSESYHDFASPLSFHLNVTNGGNAAAEYNRTFELLDITSGNPTGTLLKVNHTGSNSSATDPVSVGLGDAFSLFPPAETSDINYFGSLYGAAGTPTTFTFAVLNPESTYDLAIFADRGYDPTSANAKRQSTFTLSGANSFTNTSSTGTGISTSGASTTLVNGRNNDGHVVRYSNIVPAANGIFQVEVTFGGISLIDGTNQTNGYAGNVVRLIETPQPGAPVFGNGIVSFPETTIYQNFTGTLAGLATDPNNDPLVYAKVSGPDWLVVGANGQLSGTPRIGDIGPGQFVVSATDSTNKSARAIVRIEVRTAAPGSGFVAYQDLANPASVSPNVTNTNGTGTLELRDYITGNPSATYLSVYHPGSVSNTDPVSVGIGAAGALFPADPGINYLGSLFNSGSGLTTTFDLSGLDPEGVYDLAIFVDRGLTQGHANAGRSSTFTLAGAASFTNTSSTGAGITVAGASTTIVNGRNHYGHVVRYSNIVPDEFGTLQVTATPVSGTGGGYTGNVIRLVKKGSVNAPSFASEAVNAAPSTIFQPYSGTLAGLATDPNNDTLYFSKVSGPAWLSIDENGQLSGTPDVGDIGTNSFVVFVTDNKDGSAHAIVRIAVQEPAELVRAPFPGAAGSLTFGVVPDTQGSTNGVPIPEATAVKDRLIGHAPKFAIHVGDVTDGNHGGDAKLVEINQLNTVLTTPLANANIPLYPIRGNHDSNAHTLTTDGVPAWKAGFPHLFSGPLAVVNPADVPGGSPGTPNTENFSYVLNGGNNTFLIMLDMWNGGVDANYYDWVASHLAAIRTAHPDAHIFCVSHSGLFSLANHPAMTEYIPGGPASFIASGNQYQIDGWISGHNHIFDRSMTVDPADNNRAMFFNTTVGSASTKFYTLSRSPVANQHLNRLFDSLALPGVPIAYQIVNVNGPFVRISTWMSPKNFSGGFTDWSVWDDYAYSTNGRQFTVPAGANYNSRNIAHTSPISGTTVRIADGVNGSTTTYTYGGATIVPYRNVSIGWWNKNSWHDAGGVGIASDIVSVHGMRETPGRHRTNAYTLSLGYSASLASRVADLSLVAFLDENTSDSDPGNWIPATGATLGTPAASPVFRAPAANEPVGNWGIDTSTGEIWARLDYQGDFAIALAGTAHPVYSAEWLAAQGSSFTGAIAELDADPDGDGLTNLEEYGFGLAALIPNQRPWQLSTAPAGAGLRFRARQSAALEWTVEGSYNLQHWSVENVVTLEPGEEEDGFRELSFRLNQAMSSAKKGFFRIKLRAIP